jgi:hypothetical protein
MSQGDGHLDRNWQELLQELRVAQTGVQILTGFLLTIPFTPRFIELSPPEQAIYGVVLCTAVVATLLLMTPVALHRALFHQGARPWLVDAADRLARWGLGAQALAIVGAVWLILDFIAPWWIAAAVVTAIIVFVLAVWVLLPARERRSDAA